MKFTTICFCLKDDQILLAMKKRGFGAGKWNGYGGKVQELESIESATIRELNEESGLSAKESDLELSAIIDFYFDNVFIFQSHVFILRKWSGEPVETEEMRPQWFLQNALPFSEMWASDKHWLPPILNGEKIKGSFYFNKDGSAVEKFSWDKAEFN